MQRDTTTNFSTAVREAPRMPDYVMCGMLSSYDGKTYEVIYVMYGETGYRPTTWGRQTREWIAEKNAELGIDPATQAAYYNCSVLNAWASYSKIYEQMAKLIQPQCTGKDPIRCDDPECPVHGKGGK